MVGGSRFFGRADDAERLVALTGRHRLVTVTGAGGVGKTRLVEEVLPAIPAGRAGTVHVALLADVDAGAGPDALAARLGVASGEAVAVRTGDDPAVIVLDNCEHVLGAAAQLAADVLASSSSITIVATSREPLGVPGEVVLVLDPLAAPAADGADPLASPAVELFLDRAAAAGATWPRTEEAVAAVADVCRRVDGLPLAIELAAARTRSLSPVELLELLCDRLDVLRARDAARPERHRSVRAAVDVSVDLLDDRTRRFFHALGVLHGSFDLDLAHAVAGPEPADRLDTVDLVGELVARSLVSVEPSSGRIRYRLLEVVREHAADALREAGGWEEGNERLTDVMAAEADRIVGEGVRGWSADLIGSIIANLGNLHAAIDWCIDHDDRPERANRLFLPLFAAVHQGRAGEVRPVGERIVARWPGGGALGAEARAVLATAHALAATSAHAVELATAALADPSATAVGRVLARRALMLAAMGGGDAVAAADQARQARAEAEAAALTPFVREITAFEAGLLDAAGRHDAAAALADRALADSLTAGDAITELWARLIVATVAMRSGRLTDARAAIDRAVATSRSLDDAWWGGALFRSQARLASYEASTTALVDGWDASRDLWRAAIQRAARRGDLPELALTLRAAAVVAARAGRLPVAHALLDAVPRTGDVTVLPELFEEERVLLEATRPPAAAPQRTVVEALRLALAAVDAVDRGDAAAVPNGAPAAPARPALRFEGDVWSITYAGSTVRLRDAKGLRDLAALLERPGQEVHCLELMGGVRVEEAAGPVLDERARREYQARIIELQQDIDAAQADNDPARAERAEVELDALVRQLSEAFGIGGRSRATGSSAERARTAVTYRIRSSIRRVADVHPDLGRHLANAVRTGTWCAYRPETDIGWDVLTS